MSMAPPLVSIVLPSYNSEQFIGDAIRSIFAQTYRNYEVLVIDDGSTDNTRTIVREFAGPLRYYYQKNQGPAAARNLGIKMAQGELVCFLDADDSWTPDKLEHQVDFMERNPAVGLVFGDEEEIGESGVTCRSLLEKSEFYREITSQTCVPAAFLKLLEENFIPTSTVMVRRKCLEMVGAFDERLRGPEDRDMWSRIAARFPIACLPDKMGRKRDCPSSVSKNIELTLVSRITMWRKSRQLFPDLAPGSVFNHLLAQAYLQLGYLFLTTNRSKDARRAACLSLTHALKHLLSVRSVQELRHYSWYSGSVLVPLTLVGWNTVRRVNNIRHRLSPSAGSRFAPSRVRAQQNGK